MTRRGVEAAIGVARELGLGVTGGRVLYEGYNLVVHLEPTDVVARVAWHSVGVRGERVRELFERELALATHARLAGAPCASPAMAVPAGPHLKDGLHLSFWQLADHDPERPVDGETVGRSLRQLHEALATFDQPLAVLNPLAETALIWDQLEAAAYLPGEDLALLRGSTVRLRRVFERLMRAPCQALHGDPHLRNLLRTSGGPIWSDFEEGAHGPLGWDLACLATRARFWGPPDPLVEAALAAYGLAESHALKAWIEIRALVVLAWGLSHARETGVSSRELAERLSRWRTHEASLG